VSVFRNQNARPSSGPKTTLDYFMDGFVLPAPSPEICTGQNSKCASARRRLHVGIRVYAVGHVPDNPCRAIWARFKGLREGLPRPTHKELARQRVGVNNVRTSGAEAGDSRRQRGMARRNRHLNSATHCASGLFGMRVNGGAWATRVGWGVGLDDGVIVGVATGLGQLTNEAECRMLRPIETASDIRSPRRCGRYEHPQRAASGEHGAPNSRS